MLVKYLRGQQPGDEDRKKHDPDRGDCRQRRRILDFEGVGPGCVETCSRLRLIS